MAARVVRAVQRLPRGLNCCTLFASHRRCLRAPVSSGITCGQSTSPLSSLSCMSRGGRPAACPAAPVGSRRCTHAQTLHVAARHERTPRMSDDSNTRVAIICRALSAVLDASSEGPPASRRNRCACTLRASRRRAAALSQFKDVIGTPPNTSGRNRWQDKWPTQRPPSFTTTSRHPPTLSRAPAAPWRAHAPAHAVRSPARRWLRGTTVYAHRRAMV